MLKFAGVVIAGDGRGRLGVGGLERGALGGALLEQHVLGELGVEKIDVDRLHVGVAEIDLDGQFLRQADVREDDVRGGADGVVVEDWHGLGALGGQRF